MKTDNAKAVVDAALENATGALESVRDCLDKLCAAHLLMVGAWDPGDAVFDAPEDMRIKAFGANAAEVVAHVQSLESYLDEVRSAVALDESAAGASDGATPRSVRSLLVRIRARASTPNAARGIIEDAEDALALLDAIGSDGSVDLRDQAAEE